MLYRKVYFNGYNNFIILFCGRLSSKNSGWYQLLYNIRLYIVKIQCLNWKCLNYFQLDEYLLLGVIAYCMDNVVILIPYSGKLWRFSRFQNHPRKFSPRNFARSAMDTLRACGYVAHARGSHLHNNWTGAIRERFLREILNLYRNSRFLPPTFSAIR